MAFDLLQILKKSLLLKRGIKIVRVDKQEDPNAWFWFNAKENIDKNIFSVRDLDSYWLVLEDETNPSRQE